MHEQPVPGRLPLLQSIECHPAIEPSWVLDLQDATKDIDVVCRSEEDKERLLAAAKALDFDAVYREIEAQYRQAGEAEQKIWITYIEEGIARLQMTIADRVSKLD
jgi:hypothetical protein